MKESNMNPETDKGAWIETYSGKKFFLFKEPGDTSDICIEDIAHGLSLCCRYNGHSKKFYSVAEHSVIVSYIVSPEHALKGLMHDASESYLSDVPKPFKAFIPNYKWIEENTMNRIFDRFNMERGEPAHVKAADAAMLYFEARQLIKSKGALWDDFDKLADIAAPFEKAFYDCPHIKQEVGVQTVRVPYGGNPNIIGVGSEPVGYHDERRIIIEPRLPLWTPEEAEHKFLARFLELTGY